MEYVPYVGFAAYCHATVKIHLYFKGLMFMKCFILKKKTGSSHGLYEYLKD
jgi:hypothetical protein